MNLDGPKSFQLNFSNFGCSLTAIALIWLLITIGAGWLVKSLFVLMGLLILAPIVGFFAFRWWLKRNLVQENCPICNYPLAGFNQAALQCPSCGEALTVTHGHIERPTPPGTVDVEAIEVPTKLLED